MGYVRNAASQQTIHRAYIFLNDSLVYTTAQDGSFLLPALHHGQYELFCSAVPFSDHLFSVMVQGGKTRSVKVLLKPESSIGRVYAEL